MKKTVQIFIESFITGEGTTRETLEMSALQAKRQMRNLVKQYKDGGYRIFNVVYAADMYLEFKAFKCFTDNSGVELHEYEVKL